MNAHPEPVPDLVPQVVADGTAGGGAAGPAPAAAGRVPRRQDVYRSIRQQLPLFGTVGLLAVLTGLIPFPSHRTLEVAVAGALFFALAAAAVLVPWTRLPQWALVLVPVGFVGVVALVRDAQGGSASGLATLYLLPVVWIAFHGRRPDLVVGLLTLVAALVVPMAVVGGTAYPISEWRMVVITVGVAAVVSFTVMTMVRRERAHVADIASQSRLVRQGAEQAEEARERLASLLRAATETAVVGVDPDGLVTFFSAGAEHLLGYAADEVVGRRTIYHFIGEDDLSRRQPTVEELGGAGDRPLWSFVRRDGTRGLMTAVVTPQPATAGGPGGRPVGYVVVATDVTERAELEAERERLLSVQREVTQSLVEQNQQLRQLTQMKDDVVATVSHELRTPLTSIRGFVELLLDGAGATLDEEQAHMLRAIDRNSLQLLHVADDLLTDPGRGRGLRLQFVDTDLSDLARDAVDAMAAAAAEQHIDLSVHADEPVTVHGDPLRLHQLLGNLISNAIKFSLPGGRAAVQVLALDQHARLDVHDDGPGVPPHERDQLFERFYRLASSNEQGIPGSGLGLAIAKSVVDAHNGIIEIVDSPGWSTTFRVHLPIVAAARDEAPGTGRRARGRGRRRVGEPARSEQ